MSIDLAVLWFGIIGFWWTGYLVLDGFDFGVGTLLRAIGRTEPQRRALISTIGPVWDGNEVWLIMAVGAMFAAFPGWYATTLSAFYPLVLLVLVSLIIRVIALEYRGKQDDPKWRRRCDLGIAFGSIIPPFGWGLLFAGLVGGLPLTERGAFVGTPADWLSPYALLGGATLLAATTLHGAVFIVAKTAGIPRTRAIWFTRPLGLVAIALATAWAVWTNVGFGAGLLTWLSSLCAVAGLVVATVLMTGLIRPRRLSPASTRTDLVAFAATTTAIAAMVVTWLIALYPNVVPASNGANSLTIADAASSPYTLQVLTIVSAIFAPLVLAYQAWTYWVFRRRIRVPASA